MYQNRAGLPSIVGYYSAATGWFREEYIFQYITDVAMTFSENVASFWVLKKILSQSGARMLIRVQLFDMIVCFDDLEKSLSDGKERKTKHRQRYVDVFDVLIKTSSGL